MKNKKIIIVLILIILLQVIFKIYIDSKKEDFFLDELYSYGLMNYKQAFIFEEETFRNNWHDKSYFDEYLIVSENEKLDFSAVYENQIEDFHPPLYYLLLRIAATFTIGDFTKWTGLILNIIIFIFSAIVLYLIGKTIFKNKMYALLLVAVYGFSKFSTENTLFIRMYQLLELQLLLLTYWSIKNYYKRKLDIKQLCILILLIVLGTLTHYYYIIFLLGIYIVNIVKYIRRKQFKNVIKFIISFIIAQILICSIFPAYTKQLSSNADRSIETKMTIADKIEKVQNRENAYFKILDDHMFYIKVRYLIIAMILIGIILVITKLIKNKKTIVKFHFFKRINVVFIPTIFFWILITMTSPYIDIRYVISIFVFILIGIMYILRKELQMFIKNRKSVFIIMFVILICYTIPFGGNSRLKYQYYSSKEKIDNISEYKDIPCIYMYSHGTVLINSFVSNLNYVRQFEKVYIMEKNTFSTRKLQEILKDIDISNGIIIIDNRNKAGERAKKIVQTMEQFTKYKKIEEITIERKYGDEIYWIY